MEYHSEFVAEMFLHFTYQVAAFSNDPALVQRAAEFHYQFGRHIPTPEPGGCRVCRSDFTYSTPVAIKRREEN